VERIATMRWKVLMSMALVSGFLIARVDTSAGWDDKGISAAMVLLPCGAFGAAHPAQVWQWALAVGLWVPALNIAHGENYASLLALAFVLAGAYAGKLVGGLLGGT
jgi:hypothetical protein